MILILKLKEGEKNDKGTLPEFHYVRIYKNIVAIVFYIDSVITIELFLILQYQKTYTVGFPEIVSKIIERRNVSTVALMRHERAIDIYQTIDYSSEEKCRTKKDKIENGLAILADCQSWSQPPEELKPSKR